MSIKTQNNGAFLVLLGALCFSGSGTIQAIAPSEATPFVIGAIRLLVAGIFLLFWCLFKGYLQKPNNWKIQKVLLSVFALCAYQITFFLGIKESGVAVGTIITIGMTPITGAIFGFLFNKEIPQKIWYFSTVLAIFGLIMLNIHGVETPSLKSIILPILAGTIYAFYLSQSKDLVQSTRPELVMTYLFLMGSVLLLPIWFLFPTNWIFTTNGILVSLGLGIITTGLAYSFVMAGLKTCDTAKASTLSLAEPLGAALLGIFILKEPVNIESLIGIIAIFSSVLLLVLKNSEK